MSNDEKISGLTGWHPYYASADCRDGNSGVYQASIATASIATETQVSPGVWAGRRDFFNAGASLREAISRAEQATKKITLIIPCFNEADTIGHVIDGIPHEKIKAAGCSIDVIVVDNDSSDNTEAVARRHGAHVIHEPKRGKGQAIKTAMSVIDDDCDYVVMIDGDDTYKTAEIMRLIEPLESGFCDVVLGSRLAGRMRKSSMKFLNRLGNWFFSSLVRHMFKVNITDTLSGYFAWRHEVIRSLRPHLKSSGFAIEMEMITKMSRLGYEIYSVPITYAPRIGESSLRPLTDGRRILTMFARQLFWRPREKRIVAFVSDAVQPFHKGGKEKHLHEVSKRLVDHGREVHIYTMKWWSGQKNIELDGIYYHAICRKHALYKGKRRSISQGLLFSLACLKLTLKSFDVVNVDHIPFFPLFSMRLVCWLRRKKLYATWHEVWGREYWLDYLGGLNGRIGYLVEKIATKMPDVFISVSEHTTRRLRAAGVRRQIQTVVNGIDLEPIRQAPRHSGGSIDVIFAGRLIDHKNVDLLIKAIARVRKEHPQVKCVVVGEGPDKSSLENLVDTLGLKENVELQDFLPSHRDLYGLIKASKMLVLPSVREGFGLIVAEANACNVPVITTSHENNAAKDLIIEGENGYLTAASDKQLAKRIRLLLEKPGEMTPRETFMREFGNMNWNRVAADFNELLV